MKHGAGRIDDAGTAGAALCQTVDVKNVGLKLRGGRACDRKLDIAVDRRRQHGVDQHLGTHGGQRPCRFRKPDIVADRKS